MPKAKEPALPREATAAITEAPDELLRALFNHHTLSEVCTLAYRVAASRQETKPPQPASQRPEMRIINAIRTTDLLFWKKTGQRLTRIVDYLKHRPLGAPGRQAIYNHFGSWPLAKLAAWDDAHLVHAKRRTRGGNYTDREFSDSQLDRAVLKYAEAHAGILPGANQYKEWQRLHPDLPSYGQIIKRSNKNSNGQRDWATVLEDARRRALREPQWELTRIRAQMEAVR